MPVTGITTDVDTRTLTITAEFAAPVTRVWAMYADPRQLEQVWGPPGYHEPISRLGPAPQPLVVVIYQLFPNAVY